VPMSVAGRVVTCTLNVCALCHTMARPFHDAFTSVLSTCGTHEPVGGESPAHSSGATGGGAGTNDGPHVNSCAGLISSSAVPSGVFTIISECCTGVAVVCSSPLPLPLPGSTSVTTCCCSCSCGSSTGDPAAVGDTGGGRTPPCAASTAPAAAAAASLACVAGLSTEVGLAIIRLLAGDSASGLLAPLAGRIRLIMLPAAGLVRPGRIAASA